MDLSSIIEKVKPSIGLVFEVVKDAPLGKGTGFVFQEKGVMVTCNHVISRKGAAIVVRFPDMKEDEYLTASVLIRDEEHDLALLKFDDANRDPLQSAGTEIVKEGTPVMFSGFPLSLNDLTTHQGIISAVIKDASGIINYLIDGTVNSGNSGCPLMTVDGKVVGVVNAKRREQTDLLKKVEEFKVGAVSLHGIDLVSIYQALIENVQLGIGYAVPSTYIPKHQGGLPKP
jgi:putative serine protease PepD